MELDEVPARKAGKSPWCSSVGAGGTGSFTGFLVYYPEISRYVKAQPEQPWIISRS